MVDAEAGYVLRDGLLLACEVSECHPWFDFADLDFLPSDEDEGTLSTDVEELLDSDDSDAALAEEEDAALRSLLGASALQARVLRHPLALGIISLLHRGCGSIDVVRLAALI